MAAAIAILASDIGAGTPGRTMCTIKASGNLGNPYVPTGVSVSVALVNAALATKIAAGAHPAGAVITDIYDIKVTSENTLYRYRHVAATDKILAYVIATNAEAGAIDLSAELLHLTITAKK